MRFITPKQSGLIEELVEELDGFSHKDWIDFVDDRVVGLYMDWLPGDRFNMSAEEASELIDALKEAKQEMRR